MMTIAWRSTRMLRLGLLVWCVLTGSTAYANVFAACYALLQRADYELVPKLIVEQMQQNPSAKTLGQLYKVLQEGVRQAARSSNQDAVLMYRKLQLDLAAQRLETVTPGAEYVTVYHYTSREALKAINATGDFDIRAVFPSQQAKKKGSNKKKAVYLSPWSPAKVGNQFKKYLGVTREKYEVVIVLRLPKELVKAHTGGRGEQVQYVQQDLLVPRGEAYAIQNPYLQ